MSRNKIFFSYSFKDEEKVFKVREIIESIVDEEGNQKYSVFMASDPINGNKSGRSWNAQEKREMLNSFLILFFLSDNSVVSDGASQELDFYFNTMRKRGKEKFLYVSLNGKRCKILGNICMDSFMIDVSNVECNVGDCVYIFDNDLVTVDEVASICETISYEIISTISDRVPRIFVD